MKTFIITPVSNKKIYISMGYMGCLDGLFLAVRFGKWVRTYSKDNRSK